MGNSEFRFKKFSITNQTEGLKVTTDACVLGAISETENPNTILDIGTGTGLIALMLAQKYPNSKIKAVEIQKTIFHQAKSNVSESIYHKQIEVLHGDIKNLAFEHQFDLIVCNPPYFKNHLAAKNQAKQIALHNDFLSFEDLYFAALKHLENDGLFYVIYPLSEFLKFKNIAHNLYLQTEVIIYNKPNQIHRVVGFFSKNSNVKCFQKSMLLHTSDNTRTKEFAELMFDYYL